MTDNGPTVTAIVPCRNEGRYLSACLDSILAGDFPTSRLEILVIVGQSEDRTREIAESYAQRFPFVRALDNPRKIIPAAMNIGIRAASGDVIIKLDAHSVYPPDYVSRCVRHLVESGADNVGGVLITEPSRGTVMARAITLVLAHPFGSGNSYFRVGSAEPRWSDTAAFGCYRRDVFERIGLYNERLVRSSDMDLNTRLRRAGGRILLVPDIVARYFPRAGLAEFARRNVVDGYWALYPARFGGQVARGRHRAPLAALLIGGVLIAAVPWSPVTRYGLVVSAAAWLLLASVVSVRIAMRERDPRLIPLLPIVFAVRHFAYALGSLWGTIRAMCSFGYWSRTARRERVA